jgi:selenocysteine-specific elongation factor
VALNLVGVDHTELARGHALVVPDQWVAAPVVDVAVAPLPGASRSSPDRRGGSPPFLRRGRYKAYIGSGEYETVLRPLGEAGRFARLRLAVALPLEPGDRLVLRDPGLEETIGGAEVLDVNPAGRARSAAGHLGLSLGPRLLAGRPWLRLDELARFGGLDERGAATLARELIDTGVAHRAGEWIVAAETLDTVRTGAARLVADHHRHSPLEPGIELSALSAALTVEPVRLRAALDGDAGLVIERGRVRLVTHSPRVADDPDARRLLAGLEASPFSPPAPGELGVGPGVVRGVVREGLAVSLDGILFSTSALDEAGRRIGEAFRDRPTLTVAEVRDLLGASRRSTLAILSWLDREGFTRRRGDDRVRGPRAAG